MTCALWPILTLALPLLGAALVLLAPERRLRGTALLVTLATAAAASVATAATALAGGPGMQLALKLPLVPAWGCSFQVGVDGLSAPMLALCGVVEVVAVIASWGVAQRPRAYFALLMLLFAGTNGVFVCLDLLCFYVAWELMLVPMYLLILGWGGEQRRYAGIKYVLFTLVGSLAMLFAIVLLPARVPSEGVLVRVDPVLVEREATVTALPRATYDLTVYARSPAGRELDWALDGRRPVVQLHGLPLLTPGEGALRTAEAVAPGHEWLVVVPRDLDLQHLRLLWPHWARELLFGVPLAVIGFLCFCAAFAVKVPVVGLHTWLPHAHVQAPTAISVILAALLLKLGVYGLLRIAWPLFPTVALDATPAVAGLGLIAILYAAWVALMQADLKRLVAYSSVSHMGFCLLGLAAATAAGVGGAVVQMVTHGLGSALLFLLVGGLYDRAHHRRIDGFGGLAKPMPVFAGICLFACLASAGLPGLAGFVGEVLVILGAVQSPLADGGVRWLGLAACLGVVLTAAYLLWMAKRVLFGPLRHDTQAAWPDCSARELTTLAPLVVLTLAVGVWPQPLIDLVAPAAESLVRHLHWAGGLR